MTKIDGIRNKMNDISYNKSEVIYYIQNGYSEEAIDEVNQMFKEVERMKEEYEDYIKRIGKYQNQHKKDNDKLRVENFILKQKISK